MIPYKIEYSTPSIATTGSMYVIMLAASENGARDMFRAFYPDDKVDHTEKAQYHYLSINGRYSIYFKN